MHSLREVWEQLTDDDQKNKVPYSPDFYPGGNYIDLLPHGETRYWLFGPETGQKIVFVHGISIPSTIFKEIATYFAKKEFRVLIYDLYGRGYSASPKCDYNKTLFIEQLLNLLDKVGFDKTNVVGLSMGGAISVLFAQKYPEKVENLALIAPAGLLEPMDIPFVGRILTFPGVSKMIHNPMTRPLIERSIINRLNKENKKSVLADEIENIVMYQLHKHAGFVDSYISTIKHFPLHGLEEAYKEVGMQQRDEVLVVWGSDDETVPYRLCKCLQQYIPQARVITIPNGTHGLTVTHPEILSTHLYEFFSR
ncbi:2298_t:CDS:2 [Ambispora gerdemannii]|uniref:2298_t:CDS:1 n=1 Tax=Ambispora gerdemannii TaxID=144530 RepID=A0A9N9AQF9_9GLOM|nr:2298_t:CDS:2 [Ambispora gerdemannii]